MVLFGPTGDLAYKKIFPSLHVCLSAASFDAPVIGVGRAGWTLEQFKARARDGQKKDGGLESRCGAGALGSNISGLAVPHWFDHGSVSTSRSSNRTCRSSASRSPPPDFQFFTENNAPRRRPSGMLVACNCPALQSASRRNFLRHCFKVGHPLTRTST